MSRMNKAWKISRPKVKPSRYSHVKSIHIENPSAVVMAAAKMMPVTSPARQWMVEPSACFHSGLMNASC